MTSAIRALMTGLIDYAGLFPPAGLPMRDAVGNFARYRQSPELWMLGRIVVPARRLMEFGATFDETPEKAHQGRWDLSVLLTKETTEEDLAIAQAFAMSQPGINLGAFETPADSIEAIERLRALVPGAQEIYFELPLQAPNLDQLLLAIARNGACAKVRTGGLEKKSFPSPDALLTFLTACTEARAPWKATAGLHHALRGNAALTYKPSSPSAKMHGFLNVFLAATALWAGRPQSEALALLSGEGRGDLKIEDDAIAWRGVRLTASEIAEARRSFCRSIGSCSFTEPVGEIRDIDIPF
ncbi:MAG: hypothetical protein ABJC13_19690 [Acidobacteriota bacterium]